MTPAETTISRSTSQHGRRWFWTCTSASDPDDLFVGGSLGFARTHAGARFAAWRAARDWNRTA